MKRRAANHVARPAAVLVAVCLLAEMAITAQEHTDLKLGEVSVQIDQMRAQLDSGAEDPLRRRVAGA